MRRLHVRDLFGEVIRMDPYRQALGVDVARQRFDSLIKAIGDACATHRMLTEGRNWGPPWPPESVNFWIRKHSCDDKIVLMLPRGTRDIEDVRLVWDDTESPSVFSPELLKERNTASGAAVCAACGGPLRDPMPWFPCLRHCPKCEP
jgi:hypothetical protein